MALIGNVPNVDAVTLRVGQVVVAENTEIDLLNSSPLPADKAIAEAITKYPFWNAGQLRFRCGPNTGSFSLLLTQSPIPYSPSFKATVLIDGPGDYLWPTQRESACYNLRHLDAPAPGGTVEVTAIRYGGKLAGSGASKVIGILEQATDAAPGSLMNLTCLGAAKGIASGSIAKDDELICATDGRLKTWRGETGVDVIGKATMAAVDGQKFTLTVKLRYIP